MLLPIVICCLVANSSLTQRRKEPPGCCCSQVYSLGDVGSPCGLGSAQHCGCTPTPSVWGREPGRSPAPSRRAARSPGPHPRQTPSVAAVPRRLPLQSKGREQNWKVLEELWGGEDRCGAFGKPNLFLRQEGSGLDGFPRVTGPHRTPAFTGGETGSEREQSGRRPLLKPDSPLLGRRSCVTFVTFVTPYGGSVPSMRTPGSDSWPAASPDPQARTYRVAWPFTVSPLLTLQRALSHC